MTDTTDETNESVSADSQLGSPANGDEIPCFLLPMANGNLILPTVTVAEMAPIQPFDIKPNTPDWFLGFFPWRNTRVPVVSYETINQDAAPKLSARGRVAVLNGTGVSEDLPFIGLLTQDLPSSLRVTEASIEQKSEAMQKPYDLMVVSVGVEECVMPDIEAIENALIGLDLKRF